MKLRLQSNSIRFRVTPSEVHTLVTRGRIESIVQLSASPEGHFTYALESSARCSNVEVNYTDQALSVALPASVVREWASTEQVGIERVHPIGIDRELKISVEKDFKCLRPRPGENEVDRFPNPEER